MRSFLSTAAGVLLLLATMFVVRMDNPEINAVFLTLAACVLIVSSYVFFRQGPRLLALLFSVSGILFLIEAFRMHPDVAWPLTSIILIVGLSIKLYYVLRQTPTRTTGS